MKPITNNPNQDLFPTQLVLFKSDDPTYQDGLNDADAIFKDFALDCMNNMQNGISRPDDDEVIDLIKAETFVTEDYKRGILDGIEKRGWGWRYNEIYDAYFEITDPSLDLIIAWEEEEDKERLGRA
jgi:hypothetical protein